MRPITIHKTNYLHVDVQWHHMEIYKQFTGMHCWCHTSDFICKKISSWTLVIPRTWIRSKVVFYLQRETRCKVPELMIIKFRECGHPVFRATSPLSRGTLKSKGDGKFQYTCAPIGIRLKLFFAQWFLWISSVATEQSQICVKNTVLVEQERRDTCWQDNLTHCSSQ